MSQMFSFKSAFYNKRDTSWPVFEIPKKHLPGSPKMPQLKKQVSKFESKFKVTMAVLIQLQRIPLNLTKPPIGSCPRSDSAKYLQTH